MMIQLLVVVVVVVGQLSVLQSVVSSVTPGQSEPPLQCRVLFFSPPPQVLLQELQEFQIDHEANKEKY